MQAAARADCSHRLVGQSARIVQIREIIEKLGRSNSPVLLLGESGTGKEIIARSIQRAYTRHHPQAGFVVIDCAALAGGLAESELFGHVRGAFTGAVDHRRGLVQLADGGTAFFDEIGDLPLDQQQKLLRLLQGQEFRQVGSSVQQRVSTRVIAATNRDLAREVERGRFRQDLYFRINVVPLRVPPLRERKDDIPALIDVFLASLGRPYQISRDALDLMLSYDWPGNVRELENSIARMTTLNSGPILTAADLPSPLQYYRATRGGASALQAGENGRHWIPEPLEEIEKRAIMETLEFTRGDRTQAARMLRIGRTTLHRKLKEYQLSP